MRCRGDLSRMRNASASILTSSEWSQKRVMTLMGPLGPMRPIGPPWMRHCDNLGSMKFGQVDSIDDVDFSIPPDHPATDRVLTESKAKDLNVYVGCAKWNKADLKNFYPKGTKDELGYYSTQFNAIELNATFRK